MEQGRLHIVKYLLEHRPDIEVPGGPDDDTPLLLAAKRKRVGIVYELIKHGAKLSSVDRVGKFIRLDLQFPMSSRLVTTVFTLPYGIAVGISLIFSFPILDMPSISIDRTNAAKHRIRSMRVCRRVSSPPSSGNVGHETFSMLLIAPSVD